MKAALGISPALAAERQTFDPRRSAQSTLQLFILSPDQPLLIQGVPQPFPRSWLPLLKT